MANEPHEAGLGGRYATALLEIAQEEKLVEAVERDFASLKAMMLSSPELANFVRSPILSRADQAKGIRAILEAMGATPLATKFILLLAAKRRLFALADVIRAFENLLARQRGEVRAEVTAARALTDDELAEIRTALRAKLGREARIETRTDPSLLGGLVVKVGSRMIDSSLRTKLNGIRAAMRGA